MSVHVVFVVAHLCIIVFFVFAPNRSCKRSIAVLVPSELGSRVIGGVRVGGQMQSNVSVEHGAMTKNNVRT